MKINLNDLTGISCYDGIYIIVYQGLPIKIDYDTYIEVEEAYYIFKEWSKPIRDKIVELQTEIHNYPPLTVEVS